MARPFGLVTGLFAALSVMALAPNSSTAQQMQEKSLYQRLGGYDAIAAVVDDFIPRLASDPQMTPFFSGHSNDTKMRLRQLVVEQICSATGGPCVYIGRDMRTAHAGLGITNAHWDIAVRHLVATLNHLRVPEREQQELLNAVSGMKGDIVQGT